MSNRAASFASAAWVVAGLLAVPAAGAAMMAPVRIIDMAPEGARASACGTYTVLATAESTASLLSVAESTGARLLEPGAIGGIASAAAAFGPFPADRAALLGERFAALGYVGVRTTSNC